MKIVRVNINDTTLVDQITLFHPKDAVQQLYIHTQTSITFFI